MKIINLIVIIINNYPVHFIIRYLKNYYLLNLIIFHFLRLRFLHIDLILPFPFNFYLNYMLIFKIDFSFNIGQFLINYYKFLVSPFLNKIIDYLYFLRHFLLFKYCLRNWFIYLWYNFDFLTKFINSILLYFNKESMSIF